MTQFFEDQKTVKQKTVPGGEDPGKNSDKAEENSVNNPNDLGKGEQQKRQHREFSCQSVLKKGQILRAKLA
jgi:hypothetical protein